MNIKNTLSHRDQEPENGVLYIVGTPIGNLNDMSPRAINILRNVNLIACEDTRNTKKIMNTFSIKNNITSFNEYNSNTKTKEILAYLNNDKSVALVSDAGMPLICDPGEELIAKCRQNKLEVVCVPGPCAAITAITSSGFHSSKFLFLGFLPRKGKEREKLLNQIKKNTISTILYESPHRLHKLLKELKEYCGGDRKIHIARELTKKFEEHINSDIDNIINIFEEREYIGEFCIIIQGNNIKKVDLIDKNKLREELFFLVNNGLSLSKASKYLAKKNNLTKKFIYNLNE